MKNHDYELQLLGRISNNRESYFEFADKIHTGLFNKYPEIFDKILKLLAENKEPTIHLLIHELPKLQDVILDMVSEIDLSISFDDLIEILHERYANATISNGMTAAAMKATSTEKLETLSSTLMKLENTTNENKFDTIHNVAKIELTKLLEGKTTGLLTCFKFIDDLSGGLQPSDLIIIAAETSQGKTSLALSIAYNMVNKGKSVGIISMEMSKGQLAWRFLTYETGITKKLAQECYDDFLKASERMEGKQIHIADITNVSLQNIVGTIRSAKFRLGVECVFIDYLQLIKDSKSQNREQEIGTIARGLKNLAKELDIPIVLLSQLSRTKQHGNNIPNLSRLRDSGQIEEAADMVWFVYRPESYGIDRHEEQFTKGLAVNYIAKGRNYGTGQFYSRFTEEITRFSDDWITESTAQPLNPSTRFEKSEDMPF